MVIMWCVLLNDRVSSNIHPQINFSYIDVIYGQYSVIVKFHALDTVDNKIKEYQVATEVKCWCREIRHEQLRYKLKVM